MTLDQVTELAKQAGFPHQGPQLTDAIQLFAQLVRNAALEEAAKVCDEAMDGIWQFHPEYVNEVGRNCCANLAKRIRGLQT